MSNAVTFSGDVDVTAMSGHVLFAGGVTGYKVANHIELYGNYNLTVEGGLDVLFMYSTKEVMTYGQIYDAVGQIIEKINGTPKPQKNE